MESAVPKKSKTIKCLVWDLDNTLWDGVLLENDNVVLRDGIRDVITTLDQRGILHSIASRNDRDAAMAKLKSLGLDEYFLHPQIGWGAKSDSVAAVAKGLNIGIDALAFMDDQPFERDEVASAHPKVMCIDALDAFKILDMAEFNPEFITEDSPRRRAMYIADMARAEEEERFDGVADDFLASLGMVLTISPAKEADMARCSELTLRTNQLNTTGYTFDFDELKFFSESPDHLLWVAELTDKYGSYGKIGLVLIDKGETVWRIRLLLMSCRVMSRGVGGVIINHIRNMARQQGVRLIAEFVSNDRNRMMYVTYKFNHFEEIERNDNKILFENNLEQVQAMPEYLTFVAN